MSVLFTPVYGGTKSLSVTTSSSADTLSTSGSDLKLTNTGSNPCFVRIAGAATAAVVADLPVAAGETVYVVRNSDMIHVSAITAASTTTLYATPGDAR